MCKEISRKFRPDHRDVEVVYEDCFGVRKLLYVGLSRPTPVDVEAEIQRVFQEDDQLTANVKAAVDGLHVKL